MNSITIRALPVDEVISDLGEKLNCKVHHNCNVFTLKFPENVGVGKIVGISLSNGLGVIFYNCKFKVDTRLCFVKGEVHPVKFLYCMNGKISHRFENDKKMKELNSLQTVVVASSAKNGHVLEFAGEVVARLCSLEIDRSLFLAERACTFGDERSFIYELLRDFDAKEQYYHEGDYSLQLYDTLKLVEESKHYGILQRLFLESICNQILFQQIDQFQREMNRKPHQLLLRQVEINLIRKAAAWIRGNLDNPKNIDQLAREVGTNSNKLQIGFNIIYGATVNDFIKSERLDAARNLLTSSEMSVTEIVGQIGLVNRGYFSKLFKERYGMSPKRYRLKNA